MARPKKTEEVSEEKVQINMTKTDERVTIELIGTPNEIIGSHVIYYGVHQHIEFTDGKATVLESIAADLRMQGKVK